MLKVLAGSAIGVILACGSAMAQSCSGATYTTLTNGTPADATQVMGNFTCVLSSPEFSGSVRVDTTGGVVSATEQTTVKAASDVALGLLGSNGGGREVLGIWNNATSGTLNYAYFYAGGGATNTGSITSNGTTTAYNTTSDERLKSDRGVLSAVPELMNLRVHSFQWKSTKKPDVGLFAQEAYKVLPDIVTKGGADPNKKPWQVNYAGLIPRLLAGWQSHERRIVALEAEIAQLKAANGNQTAEIGQLKSEVTAMERKAGVRTAQR